MAPSRSRDPQGFFRRGSRGKLVQLQSAKGSRATASKCERSTGFAPGSDRAEFPEARAAEALPNVKKRAGSAALITDVEESHKRRDPSPPSLASSVKIGRCAVRARSGVRRKTSSRDLSHGPGDGRDRARFAAKRRRGGRLMARPNDSDEALANRRASMTGVDAPIPTPATRSPSDRRQDPRPRPSPALDGARLPAAGRPDSPWPSEATGDHPEPLPSGPAMIPASSRRSSSRRGRPTYARMIGTP